MDDFLIVAGKRWLKRDGWWRCTNAPPHAPVRRAVGDEALLLDRLVVFDKLAKDAAYVAHMITNEGPFDQTIASRVFGLQDRVIYELSQLVEHA